MSSSKKIPVTLVLHLEYELPEDADEKWRIEENLCLDNLVEKIPKLKEDECTTCPIGFALVGHVTKDQIKREDR